MEYTLQIIIPEALNMNEKQYFVKQHGNTNHDILQEQLWNAEQTLNGLKCVINLVIVQWNGNVVLTKFSSLAELEIIKITTCCAVNDENFMKMTFANDSAMILSVEIIIGTWMSVMTTMILYLTLGDAITPKTDANFVISGGNEGCCYDNLQ